MVQNAVKVAENAHCFLVVSEVPGFLEKNKKVVFLIDRSVEVPVEDHRLDFALDLLPWKVESLRQVAELNSIVGLDQFEDVLLKEGLVESLQV